MGKVSSILAKGSIKIYSGLDWLNYLKILAYNMKWQPKISLDIFNVTKPCTLFSSFIPQGVCARDYCKKNHANSKTVIETVGSLGFKLDVYNNLGRRIKSICDLLLYWNFKNFLKVIVSSFKKVLNVFENI